MSLAMEHAQTKGPDRPAEAFLTGVALGQIQVTLGLYALSGTGASAATWFVTLLCWLVGGLVGALWQKRKPAAASEQALAYAVVGLLWTCAATAQIIPFPFWRVYPCCLPRCVAVRCLAVFWPAGVSGPHTQRGCFSMKTTAFSAALCLPVCCCWSVRRSCCRLPLCCCGLRGSCEDNMRRNTRFRSY